jgi:hypothetical protein
MTVDKNEPSETVVETIVLSRTAAVFVSIGVVVVLSVVVPLVISLWRWAL